MYAQIGLPLCAYGYAGSNPVAYTDPTGLAVGEQCEFNVTNVGSGSKKGWTEFYVTDNIYCDSDNVLHVEVSNRCNTFIVDDPEFLNSGPRPATYGDVRRDEQVHVDDINAFVRDFANQAAAYEKEYCDALSCYQAKTQLELNFLREYTIALARTQRKG